MAVVGAAAVIAFTLISLLIGGFVELVTPKVPIRTYMPDATGVARNAEVRLSGIPIGKVTRADVSGYLDPQRAVRVDMKIRPRFLRSIPSDSLAIISEDNLVGVKFISIEEGKSPIPLNVDGVLATEPLKDAADRADLILALRDELNQVDQLLVQVSSPDTKVGHFVMRDEEYQNLLRRVSNFSGTLHEFVSQTGPVGQALFTNTLYDNLSVTVQRVDNQLSAIQRGEGTAGRLYASDQQYNDLVRTLRDLRTSLASMDGKLNDDAMYRRASELLRTTDVLLNEMTMGEGAAARLLRDPQFYESMTGSLRDLSAFLHDLDQNPGKYLRLKVR
jgi:ABC-type transporter Mla subunit MlaD